MMRVTVFKDKTVAVFGLGASGTATAEALIAGGAKVAAWDDGEPGRAAAAKAGVPLVDLQTADWSQFAALVLAPGVPLTHPEPHWTVKKAQAAGVEIIGDVELFFRERALSCPEAPVIAITGTNGKSTTTALVAHILRELGCDVQMGGNIGRAVLTLESPAPDRIYVLELSSFQIDLTPTLKPTVGVLLNITPDHIDRHGTVEHYAEVKERLILGAEAACIGVEDEFTRAMARSLRTSCLGVDPTIGPRPRALYPFAVDETASPEPILFTRESSEGLVVCYWRGPVASLAGIRSLRGRHNAQNALAAITALSALQDRMLGKRQFWDAAKVESALRSFPGLPHRMEEIGSLGRVLFINDSKATNADSTDKALASWERGIYWILGGKSKDGGITTLEPFFPRIAKAYLIGAASDEFAATLDGKVAFERCGTLDVAVAAAVRDASTDTSAEPVVLLSPASASYDQYKNFEVRGDHFRKLVTALPGIKLVGKPS
jgi:UDP-N-acetylmuramoylalanine--D-glutamate ligase